MAAGARFIGQRVPRLEDGRLLRGKASFVDDVDLPGQLAMRLVRSSVSHGLPLGRRVGGAYSSSGPRRTDRRGLRPRRADPLRIPFEGLDLEPYLQPVLARDRVRYVGEPVALVLAEDPYTVEDAAELG